MLSSHNADRQAHGETAAFAGHAFRLDSAFVRGNDPGHETETEPQSLNGVGLGVAHAIEAVENVRQIVGGNPHTGILHYHPDPALLLISAYVYTDLSALC